MTLLTLLASASIVTLPLGAYLPLSGWKCGDVGGAYNHGTNQIYLCNVPNQDMEFAKYHELGHYFWFMKMTDEQKKAYEKISLETGVKLEEEFADNFAYMVKGKRHRFPLQKRINFIKKTLGEQ